MTENELNDDFLDRVNNNQEMSQNITPEPEEKDGLDIIKARKAQLEAEIKLKDQENIKKPEEVVTPDLFEQQIVSKQIEKPEESVIEEPQNPNMAQDKPNISSEEIVAVKKPKKTKKQVEILTPEQAEALNHPVADNSIGVEVPTDDFEKTIKETQEEYSKDNAHRLYGSEFDDYDDNNDANSEISQLYEEEDTKKKKITKVEVVDAEIKDPTREDYNKKEVNVPNTKRNMWYGGDGKITSFKNRTAKNAKILRNIEIDDTSSIKGVDISSKSTKDRIDFYKNNVLTTLQPNYTVIPCIVSGVVITMRAFGWSNIAEICKIDEKLDNLNPEDSDYIYNKNMIFIERREKQLDLFYDHIISVSGYNVKPDKETLYGKIIKFPDFPQLFFAAYCATFPKQYTFDITCGNCGYDNNVSVSPKDLCFLLNKNINIDRLSNYIKAGGSLNSNETAEVYRQFQDEELIKQCNKTFRIKHTLPNSAFIYELKIPTIYEVIDTLKEIADVFRDKSFEYIELNEEDGENVGVSSIDSSFGLPPYLLSLRKYLYLSSLMVAQPVREEGDTVKVNYVTIKDKSSIIGSIYNLSADDYDTLMNDPQLNALVKCVGIQHAIKAGICKADSCKNDMGIIPVDPETLFFTIARRRAIR